MDILDKFIEQTKENIRNGYYKLSSVAELNKKRNSLKQRLTQHFSLIAEIKHASPSGEYSFDFIDVEKAASTFKNAGADAISVVVEPKIFKGHLNNIPIVKKTSLPVLFKDFIIKEDQIRTAAALGADCILLIMKVAERLNLDLNKFIKIAHYYGLEVLLECYDKKEMQKALETKADILGINNRDLQTLQVDLNRTKEIMEFFSGTKKIDRPIISESGIKSRKDAEFVKSTGVNGILVGTALWTATDQYAKIKELKLNDAMIGKFGEFGGRFVPETLMPALEELEKACKKHLGDSKFKKELNELLRNYAGRPTPLYFAESFSKHLNIKIYFKREDLLHGGAHKINNTLGQALLAKKMGKTRVIAETGAGQHGVATAMACAALGLKCEIYMGAVDVERQKPNVLRMKLCGAKLNIVNSGSKTLKDAINEALRDWVTNVRNTYYMLGSVVGPHPYPTMVREFQRIIGKETKQQCLDQMGRLPDVIVACVGGGSNAIGIFYDFLKDNGVKLLGVEAAGEGLNTNKTSATLSKGSKGMLHGSLSYLLQNIYGQVSTTHSIAAGLDYPGVGPEHAYLKNLERVKYVAVTDKEALKAFKLLSKLEGIIPALEPAHAIAYVMKLANQLKNKVVVINLSGRGDKDIEQLKLGE